MLGGGAGKDELGPLQSAMGARGARNKREAEAHSPLPKRGLGVGRYRLLWG